MKDFNTGKEIDMQGMLDMLRYAEEAERVTMNSFISIQYLSCGTSGCLIGTYIIRARLRLGLGGLDLADASAKFYNERCFGLSDKEKDFLFIGRKVIKSKRAVMLTKEQAIARLRKFIYYKLRKAELLDDYQASRRIEGNKFFTLAYANS